MLTLPLMLICSFNSRTPGGVRPSQAEEAPTIGGVSIHAPREGCDLIFISFLHYLIEFRFNSRTPGGVRHTEEIFTLPSIRFQFTHPGRGATIRHMISLHQLLVFQFTHPGRGATQAADEEDPGYNQFQFTHPGRGATLLVVSALCSLLSFNSRTPGGVRQCGAKLRIIGRINKRNLRLGVLS